MLYWAYAAPDILYEVYSVTDQLEKEFGGKVPIHEYNDFKKNFPQYGATNWLVNTALAEVNRLVREDAGVANIVQRAIQQHLDARRT